MINISLLISILLFTDQNFLMQKLTMHPALPESTLYILQKICAIKDKRKAKMRLRLKRKTKAVQADGNRKSDVVINVDAVPGQSNWTNNTSIANNSQFLPVVPDQQLVIWPQQASTTESAVPYSASNAVPNQQLVMWSQPASLPNVAANQQLVVWPQQGSTDVPPGSAAPHSNPNAITVANFQLQTTQTQYYSITSTTSSANVPVSTNPSKPIPILPNPFQPATSQSPHISENMKSLIMEFLKSKYAEQPNISQAFDLKYPTIAPKQLPPVAASTGNSVESCIDLTFEDPNNPNLLETLVEELMLPDVIADDNFDGAADADPLSLDTATNTVTADPIAEDVEKTSSPGDKTINVLPAIVVPIDKNELSCSGKLQVFKLHLIYISNFVLTNIPPRPANKIFWRPKKIY